MLICALCETTEYAEGKQISLVLDSISSLEWIGAPISELKQFVRAVHSICRKVILLVHT